MRYIDLVNIKMGTHSSPARSCGNTNPLTARPFGMDHFLPQTVDDTDTRPYHPDDIRLFGIRLTHIPSPWIGDYQSLLMLPTTGTGAGAAVDGKNQTSFDTNSAVLTPAYMSFSLLRYGIRLELTPSLRGAAIRASWDENVGRFVDGAERRGFYLKLSARDLAAPQYEVDWKNGQIFGYCSNFRTRRDEGIAKNFRMYFVFKFNCGFDAERSILTEGALNIAFSGTPSSVEGRFATSFISVEQARFNLESELSEKSFSTLRKECEDEWEQYLSRIEITADERTSRTFYSCLYRAFLFPRVFHEPCPDGVVRHFSPELGEVRDGVFYVDNGFWDTYKTVYPLYSLIAADKYEEICRGFVNFYKESGWLPRWISPGAVDCMPGTAIDAVFGDAAVKGVVSDRALLEDMLEALLKHADNVSPSPRYGRDGIEDFKTIGYVSNAYKESVNKTLDYAYGDFCISRVADAVGKQDISDRLLKTATNYRNLFDAETGFMRARDRDGKMREDFSEFDWGGDYTEGGAWQNSFAVYHDLLGYAALLGGRDRFLELVQRLFDTPPYYKEKGYSSEIHEMTEMALLGGFGQCALSNQPSFHVPYLFSCLGDRDRSAYWVRRCADELFSPESDGFPGDEDNGSMACWYVFSALGFYPVCPGTDEYVFASPSVKGALLHLSSGRTLKIKAPLNSPGRIYARVIRYNGVRSDSTVIKHSELMAGGTLEFIMSSKPSGQAYTDDRLPFSLSAEQ